MEYNNFKEKIEKVFFEKLSLQLTDCQSKSFFDFMKFLLLRNEVMNLTAITDPDEVIMKHFLDSCMVLKFFNDFDKKYIIDIGTGAGFPGIPLAIMCPNTKFVLTDTLGKRINFLQDVLDIIFLKNVELVKGRSEDLANNIKYREKFDYVLSRGVAKISIISEYSLPFTKNGGKMLAYKMDDCDAELTEGKKAINILGGTFHVKHPYILNYSEPKRCILEINKIKNSPKMYPRKAGTPSKNPIK